MGQTFTLIKISSYHQSHVLLHKLNHTVCCLKAIKQQITVEPTPCRNDIHDSLGNAR